VGSEIPKEAREANGLHQSNGPGPSEPDLSFLSVTWGLSIACVLPAARRDLVRSLPPADRPDQSHCKRGLVGRPAESQGVQHRRGRRERGDHKEANDARRDLRGLV
jgi:hypothetical protein